MWKHFALLTVLDELLDTRTPDVMSYFETHAGAGVFHLEETGDWTEGVARLLERGFSLSAHPYVRIAGPQVAEGFYPGSWMCVLERLRQRSVTPSIMLCDTSAAVEEAVMAVMEHRGLDELVTFRAADGFTTLRDTPRADLVLIDPPYAPDPDRDWRRVAEAMLNLHDERVAALAWYPLLVSVDLPVRAIGLPCFEAKWADEGFAGCGVMTTGAAADALVRARSDLGEVATHLDAVFRVHRGA